MMTEPPTTLFAASRKGAKPPSDHYNRDSSPEMNSPNANSRPQLLQNLHQLPFTPPNGVQMLQIMQQLSRPPSVIRKSRITATRALLDQEYENYRRTLDTQTSSVERHFEEAVKKAKQLSQPKKKKPEGGK